MIGTLRQGLAAAAATAVLGLGLPATAPAACIPLPLVPCVDVPVAIPGLPTTLPTDPTALGTLLSSGLSTTALSTVVNTLGAQTVFNAINAMAPAEAAPVIAQLEGLAGSSAQIDSLLQMIAAAASGGTTGGGTTGGGTTGGGTTGGGTTGGGTTTKPGGGTTGGGTTGGGTTGGTTGGGSTSIRLDIAKVAVSKSRKSVAITLVAPTLPSGLTAWGVYLTGKVAGKRAFKDAIVSVNSNSTLTTTQKITSSMAKRLKTKGGTLTVSAAWLYTSGAPTNKSAKVKKPKAKKKHKKR
jgi:hypothetical protein